MKTQVISFHCVLRNSLGQFISSSFNRDVINEQNGSETLGDLVKGLKNAKPGETREIKVRAERAYGLYNPELVGEIPRAELSQGANLIVGDEISLSAPGKKGSQIFRVISASEDALMLDGNHPLAGQDLVFNVDITEVRDLRDDDEPLKAHKAPTKYRYN